MKLPLDFQFSQGNLQDFVDCRRRFLLRHVHGLAWPAVETEPALASERFLQQGALFHRMIQQNLLGVSADRLAGMLEDPEMKHWWDNFREFSLIAGSRHPEISLWTALGDYRLVAKFDLVIVTPEGQAVILDWKTSRRAPERHWLAERLQTRVYPYLLVQAGAQLNQGTKFPPDQVEMVYWYASFPDLPEHFDYNEAQYQVDGVFLNKMVETIPTLTEEDFTLTEDDRRCRFCVYRSLCGRGVEAGTLEELEEDSLMGGEIGIDLDFQQIAEVEL